MTVKSSSGKCIATYAFIDNSSTSSFITEELQEKLNPKFVRTSLRLRTMNGADTLQSCLISDLDVSDFNGNNTVQLPKAYTIAEIPVSEDEIPQKKPF